jgi:predicted nucleic acid-binding protein
MVAAIERAVLDTSVFVATESGRQLDVSALPEESAISAVTLGELQAGVLAARDVPARARRLRTLEALSDVELLPADAAVAASWAVLRVQLAESGRRLNVNDLWMAATALAHGIPLVTQDSDFGPADGAAGLVVIQA